MQKRTLGNCTLGVSAPALGCRRMSHDESPLPDKQEMIAFLHAAVDRGITFFDTIVQAWLDTQRASMQRLACASSCFRHAIRHGLL